MRIQWGTMSVLEIMLLGAVQGLTEFIPVSSSGHLVIFQQLLDGASDHFFLEFINIGTLAALLVFFRRKITQIVRDILQNKNFTLARNILLTAIPAGVIGYVLADFISSNDFFGSLIVVTVALAVVGAIMVIIDRLPKASMVASGEVLPAKRALYIGLAQTFALIPGVSRSGSTMIAGRLAGMSSSAAAEYSFLASLPIMVGVTLNLFVRGSNRDYLFQHIDQVVIGNICAFIVGLLAVRFLMSYLSRHGLQVFGWYRLGLAGVLSVVILLHYQ